MKRFFYLICWCILHRFVVADIYEIALESIPKRGFTYLPIWGPAGSIKFQLKTNGNARILLSNSKSDNPAEIQFMAHLNNNNPSTLVIYGEEKVTQHTPGLLDPDNYLNLTLSWEGGFYTLMTQQTEPVLEWVDPEKNDFKYFGFATDSDNGNWNVEVPLKPCEGEKDSESTRESETRTESKSETKSKRERETESEAETDTCARSLLKGCAPQGTTYTSHPFGLYHYVPTGEAQRELRFLVKSPSSVYFALSSHESIEPPLVELQVHLGVENNSKTYMFVRQQEGIAVDTPLLLSGEHFTGFRLSWGDGSVSLWTDNDTTGPLVAKKEDVPLNVKYFGFKTHDDTGYWIINPYTSHPFGLYRYVPIGEAQRELTFLVTSPSSVYFALSSHESIEPPLVELQVHLGVENNSKTYMFVRQQEGIAVDTPLLLSGEHFTGFRLSWGDGSVSLWTDNDTTGPLVAKKEDVPLNVKYFGFKTHDDTGYWIINHCVRSETAWWATPQDECKEFTRRSLEHEIFSNEE